MKKTTEAVTGLLRFTGHPLADVGVATLCALAGRDDPAMLTDEDLDRVTRDLRRDYFSGLMQSYLTCVFMNSEYVQHGAAHRVARCSPIRRGLKGAYGIRAEEALLAFGGASRRHCGSSLASCSLSAGV